MRPLAAFGVRLLTDESGDDLVEYALLAGFLALATWAGWSIVQSRIHDSYGRWDTNQQNLWEPPDPGGS